MDLIFLGRGCSNNVKQKNNAAYFIENNELFLIDCGESVFAKLKENNLLDNINTVHIMITHTLRSCWEFRDFNFILLFQYQSKGKYYFTKPRRT